MIINEVIGEVLLNPFHKLKGSNGGSLYKNTKDLSLIVFVRHFGCIFCRETMKVLSRMKKEIESQGVQLIIVHQSDFASGSLFLNKYGLSQVIHFSDPDLHLYKQFGLNTGRFSQLLGPIVWKDGFRAVLKNRVIFGRKKGNAQQLGGFFLMEGSQVRDSYICKTASDIPDIIKFLGNSRQGNDFGRLERA